MEDRMSKEVKPASGCTVEGLVLHPLERAKLCIIYALYAAHYGRPELTDSFGKFEAWQDLAKQRYRHDVKFHAEVKNLFNGVADSMRDYFMPNASVSISGDEPEYAPGSCSVVRFDQLTAGDRFEALGRLWTKIDCDVARKHSEASLMRGAKGYGYIGDSLCSFDPQDVVSFVAPNS
jgi:hypothetical protein